MKYDKYKLCYLQGREVFFTTQDITKQWGDDWDDVPYEHNAGFPYSPTIYYYADGRKEKSERDFNKDGSPKWELIRLNIDNKIFDEPCDTFANSPYSVKDINEGKVPWLSNDNMSIYANISLENFLTIMKVNNVTVTNIENYDLFSDN